MILALSTYYQPFRAILINNDGAIRGIYRPLTDEPEDNGFYQFPLKDVVDVLLSEDISLYDIKDVVIFGKPMLFFEMFLKHYVIPPGIKKAVKFGENVLFFMEKIFRIRRDIDAVLRFTPNYWFLPAMESYVRVPMLLNWKDDMFFWGSNAEFAQSVYINYNRAEVVLLNRFYDEYRKYMETEVPEKKNEILECVLNTMDFKTGMVIANPVKGLKLSPRKGIQYCFDAPTLGLAGMCDLYFSYSSVNTEISNKFRTEFFESTMISVLDTEVVMNKSHNLIDISGKKR